MADFRDKHDLSLEELMKLDAAGGLDNQASGTETVVFPDDPRNVIMHKLTVVPSGREEIEVDFKGATQQEDVLLKVKARGEYQYRIYFYVQRELVSGLRFAYYVHRKGICVDKSNHMVGSYGPKAEPHVFTTPVDEFPSGIISYGTYDVEGILKDDKGNDYQVCEWKYEVGSDWN